jgi:RNA polymerase sigma factor (TIGR02999 family)
MVEGSAKDVTTLLGLLDDDSQAEERLFRLVQQRFHAMARRKLRGESPDHTLQATALVDDAFRKLISGRRLTWQNREQFFAATAKVMRQILVDCARKRDAAKRGSGRPVASLEGIAEPPPRSWNDAARLVELNDLIEQLERQHPETFQVFNLHYFMGYELKEIAEDILMIPYTTVKRRWANAKAILHRELVGGD